MDLFTFTRSDHQSVRDEGYRVCMNDDIFSLDFEGRNYLICCDEIINSGFRLVTYNWEDVVCQFADCTWNCFTHEEFKEKHPGELDLIKSRVQAMRNLRADDKTQRLLAVHFDNKNKRVNVETNLGFGQTRKFNARGLEITWLDDKLWSVCGSKLHEHLDTLIVHEKVVVRLFKDGSTLAESRECIDTVERQTIEQVNAIVAGKRDLRLELKV